MSQTGLPSLLEWLQNTIEEIDRMGDEETDE